MQRLAKKRYLDQLLENGVYMIFPMIMDRELLILLLHVVTMEFHLKYLNLA
jgi:hypothetical protein